MENSYRFFENRDCRYYPCHKNIDEMNCLFCYCPMYHMTNCPGNPVYSDKGGRRIKVCTSCVFPHLPENYDKIMEILRKNGESEEKAADGQ